MKLVLKVINELTCAALKIQNEQRNQEFQNCTSEFVSIILSVWKIFNVNTPYKDIRLNDDLCRPLTYNDDRFAFLTQIVFWLEAWQALAPDFGKLTKQTFTSFRHACISLQEITNYLTGCCGFDYLLTSFLQTDPLEHHFGYYRMMSGSNYHISYLQILETERRIKVSSILSMFSSQHLSSQQSIRTFIQSFSSPSCNINNQFCLEPFLNGIPDLSTIHCSSQVIQSLAFIAGYSTHQYLKRSQNCGICTNFLTIDKTLFIEGLSQSDFKLLELTDRGSLKYPSEPVLESILTLWKLFSAIENDRQLMTLLVDGPARNILVELSIIYIENCCYSDVWISNCPKCKILKHNIPRKLVFVAANCFVANKVKNYNSMVITKLVRNVN